jgi:hypothetical protein
MVRIKGQIGVPDKTGCTVSKLTGDGKIAEEPGNLPEEKSQGYTKVNSFAQQDVCVMATPDSVKITPVW